MAPELLSTRLSKALGDAGLSPAGLASRAGFTEATISNWLNDKVQTDHVKASVLLRISSALGVRPQWLLLGEGRQSDSLDSGDLRSQPLKLDTLRLSLQLVAEELDAKGLTLPPAKRAELCVLVYELLEEGMPEAKVLRFARAAAA
jgi:transcriptional regulator with XRE-family HTH domain